MSFSLFTTMQLQGPKASMLWCAQSQQESTKRDHDYTRNLTSSILFANNPEEGT